MAKLEQVEGIGASYARKLRAAGVRSSNSLLSMGATPQGRKQIAAAAGISEANVLEWVNHVDLFRIKGVGEEYADLLEAAGVDTVPELAQRNPQHLIGALHVVNRDKRLVRKLPGVSQVRDWCRQAKRLKRMVRY